MTDQHPDQRDAEGVKFDIFRSIDRLRLSTWIAISFERLWPLVLPFVLLAGVFLCLAWFGIFRLMPDLLRLGTLGLFIIALAPCVYFVLKFRLPDQDEIDQRLEKVNALDHQPITVQSEELATSTSDPFARALWDEHRRRMAERIRNLKSDLPQTRVPEIDPWGLRAIVGLLLVVAFAFSGGPLGGHISDAFRSHGGSSVAPPRIDAWVTPPRYTGRAPQFLTSAANAAERQFTVPENSILTIRVIGGNGTEKVTLRPQDGMVADVAAKQEGTQQEGAEIKDRPRNFEMSLGTTSTAALFVDGRSSSEWAFSVIPDQPPSIRFTKEPSSAANGTMEVAYELKDDYGAVSAVAKMEQATPPEKDARPLYKAPDLPLALPRRGEQAKETKTAKDLTEHPWAGSEIRMTLVATDDAKQEARSETKTLVMPERPFANPLARAVVEQRRILALNANAKQDVLNTLDAITMWPEETIKNASHYLALRSVHTRLDMARSDDQLRDVVAYMWQVARGIEDGALSEAERRLREAQEALKQALERGASQEEIERRMAELRQAMNQYLREFAEKAQKNPNMAQAPNPNMQELRQEDLDRMLDQIEDLAKQGSRDQAQQLLSELENMLNNLQMGQNQRGQNGQQGQMRQQMDKLGELMRRQQDMMNQTHRLEQQRQNGMQQNYGQNGQQGQDGQQGNQGQMSDQEIENALRGLQEGQNKLRSDLDQMMEDLKGLGINPGKDFGDAGKSMGEAGKSLGEADGGQALDQQSNALDALRRGGQDMMKQMQQAMGQEGQTGPDGRQQNGRLDPLGRERRTSGIDDGTSTKVPGEIDIQRAREILDAIRRRLGNALSPQMEKDYLERLLKFD
ncbi:MAG: TIGR02302 family protein [Phyllobacterium sp.]|uniref:TIGR02302 family protein n=1 Tax=Phyllobacterium sp. TaxID=1871046 RepID=UPI0030F013CA